MKLKPWLVALAVAAIAVVVALAATRTTIRQAAESYVYGYPLVLMDVTQRAFTATRAAPNAQRDADGEPLSGERRYVLHFPAGGLPPVRAFWSVTAYDGDGFLVANPIGRYALGDRDPLTFNADGSLDIYMQAEPPEPGRRNNWLPVGGKGAFRITARLYWPQDAILNGDWRMPGIQRITH